MLIVFRSSNQRRWMDVKLENGCHPCIGSRYCSINEIDAAVWFKVLVLETICVDCDKKKVSWTYSVQPSMKRRGTTMDSLQPFASRTIDAFEMGCTECCDSEEEVDEVFATARQLTDRIDRSDTEDHHQERVLQLLNSYLLPAVSFEVQDAPFLQMAIEDHDIALRRIDFKIEDVSEKYKESKEDMSRVISDLAPVCSDLVKANMLPKHHLQSLYDDLNKEFRRAQEDLCARAAEVEEQKLTSSGEQDGGCLINSLREERQMAHQHVTALVTAREHVYEVLCSCQQTSEENQHEVCISELPHELQAYLYAIEKKAVAFKLQQTAFDEKLLAASVRESLKETWEQLRKGQPTQGVTKDVYGGYATEVHSHHSRKQTKWQDVKSWIAEQLKLPGSCIGKAHHEFCDSMEAELSDVVSVLRASHLPGTDDYKSLTSAQIGVDVSDFDDAGVQLNAYRDSIKPSTKRILDHIQMMSELIAEQLQEQHETGRWTNRIWITYERYCYDLLGPFIEQMYQFYHFCDQKFCEKLESLAEKSPSEMDVGLPEAPWLIIFNKERIEQENQEECSLSPPLYSLSPSPSIYSRSLANFKINPGRSKVPSVGTLAATVVAGTAPVDNGIDDLKRHVERAGDAIKVPTFRECFGDVSDQLQNLLCQTTPFSKLLCLTSVLKKVTSSIALLKSLERQGHEVADVGGDDLLPGLVLVLTRLNPNLVSSIRYQTCMLEDLMPEFLTRGCHAFALAEFQIAFQVIESLL